MISRTDFGRIVEEALEGLPSNFRTLLENVAVVIEEEPTDDDYFEHDVPDDDDLLGVFRGVPRTLNSWNMPPMLPNQIVLFRGPILRQCESPDEAIEEIRDTVIHELGHYFGLDDEEMPY